MKMPAFSLDLFGISWNFMGFNGVAAKTFEAFVLRRLPFYIANMLDVEGSMLTIHFPYIYLNKKLSTSLPSGRS